MFLSARLNLIRRMEKRKLNSDELYQMVIEGYKRSIAPRKKVVYYVSLKSIEFHAIALGVSVKELKERFNLEELEYPSDLTEQKKPT